MGLICCNPISRIITGVWPEDPVDPPVLSEYCVQWSQYDATIFFPCGENNTVNGQSGTCGSTIDIADFLMAGNLFRYIQYGAFYYIQVIAPAANGLVANFGDIEYDVFGNPSGPVPIGAIQSQNCFVNCWTATFDVGDVDVDGFTGYIYNEIDNVVDFTADLPFSDPNHDANAKANMVGYFEPSMTFTSSYVGNTVTVTITTIMTIFEIQAGAPSDPSAPRFPMIPCS